MSQADIGVNVFLIDAFTSPMGLIEGAMGLFASSLISGMSSAAGMSEQLGVLAAKMAEQEAAMLALKEEQSLLTDAFNAGNMSLADYGTASLNNANAQAALSTQMENTAADSAILESQLGDLTGTMTLMGMTMGAGIDFLSFAGGLDAADKAAADLTDTMNSMAIAGNLTNNQLTNMQEYLFTVANASIYSADEVAQGFNLMMEKGQSASAIIQGVGQDATNLAEALGQKGVVDSADLLASTLQMFNMKASQSGMVANALFYAFYHGIPSVNGLQAAMNAVGGQASALHVPFNEVITMLDALGRAGLSGSMAGTALRYILQSMYEPTQKQANELQTLGIITANKVTPAFQELYNTLKKGDSALPKFDGTVAGLYNIWAAAKAAGELPVSSTFLQWADSVGMLNNKFYDAKGNQRDFMDSFGVLVLSIQQHSKTPQAFADSLAQMFNVRSGQGFADILGHINSLSKAQKDLLLTEENAGLSKAAQEKMNSQNAQMKALQTTFTDFMAQVGKPLQDMFAGALSGLNKFVGGLTTGNPQVHQFFTAFLSIGAVLGGLGLLVGIIMLIGAFAGAIIGPILLVAGAIIAVAGLAAGGFMFIQSHMKQVQQFLAPFIADIQGLFKDAGIQKSLGELGKAFGQLGNALKPLLPVLGGLAAILAGVLVGAIHGLVMGGIMLIEGLIHVFQGLAMVVTGVVNVIVGVWKALWFLLAGVFYLITGNTKKASESFGFFGQAVHQIIGGVVSILEGFGHIVVGLFVGVFGFIGGFIGGFVKGIIHFFQFLANTLVHHSIIPDMIKSIFSWFANLLEIPTKFIGGIINGIIAYASLLLTTFHDHILKPIQDFFSKLLDNALQWGSNFINMLINGIKGALGGLWNTVTGIAGNIKNLLGFHSPTKEGPGSDADTWMPNMMTMFVHGIVSGTPGLSAAAHGAAAGVRGAFTSPSVLSAQGLNGVGVGGVGGSASSSGVINFCVDGKVYTQIAVQGLTKQVAASGVQRMLH